MVGSKMPPRTSLTSTFSVTDANNEVVCPLRNQDGSNCRKRCVGEKRFRSMQEHIRRAHPEHYIPKLPATEDSFLLMINTPPHERPNDQSPTSAPQGFRDRQVTSNRGDDYSATPNSMLGTASAAAVLAELHGIKSERDYDSDGYHSDMDGRHRPRSSIELPSFHQISHHDITSDPFSGQRRDILPSLMSTSPPERSSTLPPIHRQSGPNRPRKHSVTKRSKESYHKKKSSLHRNDWFRRIQDEDIMRPGMDRKALSMEPSTDFGKRWEDLIDAADQAASAAGDIEDRTPMPQSPVSIQGGPPPLAGSQQFQSSNYQASPLQQALTPPSFTQEEPFPSVESGENFHMGSRGLDSSPTSSSQNTQIYCAACQNVSLLKRSYACTECICGFCAPCVEILMAEHGARRKCPRCATIGGRFKPFQLEIR